MLIKCNSLKFFCFSQSIVHLGHILSHDLLDREDIVSIKKDLCRKANCLLHIFSSCNPHIKSILFQSFCLSLYGSTLWNVSSPELQHLEVACNNILKKIWSLPRRCHTSILHLVASIQSIYYPSLQYADLSCIVYCIEHRLSLRHLLLLRLHYFVRNFLFL